MITHSGKCYFFLKKTPFFFFFFFFFYQDIASLFNRIDQHTFFAPPKNKHTHALTHTLTRTHARTRTDSGFNKVGKVSYEKKLLQIHGNMSNVTVRRVPMSWESLNRGDCFVLDSGSVDPDYPEGNTDGMMIMILQGDSANAMMKMKTTSIAQGIIDSRGGKPDRQTFAMSDVARMNGFWRELGSMPPPQVNRSSLQGGAAMTLTPTPRAARPAFGACCRSPMIMLNTKSR